MSPETKNRPIIRPKFYQKLLQPSASVVLSIAALAPTPKDPQISQMQIEPFPKTSHTLSLKAENRPEIKLAKLNNKVFAVQIASDKQPQNTLPVNLEIIIDPAREEPVQEKPVQQAPTFENSAPQEPLKDSPIIPQSLPQQPAAEDLVWYELENCESSHNPKAVDPSQTYFGLYQFDDPTWQNEGGSGHASDASPQEQLMRAKSLQKKNGWWPWPACARLLGLLK